MKVSMGIAGIGSFMGVTGLVGLMIFTTSFIDEGTKIIPEIGEIGLNSFGLVMIGSALAIFGLKLSETDIERLSIKHTAQKLQEMNY